MPRRWLLAPGVEELIGPDGVEQLAAIETFTCSCGQRSQMDAEPVSVIVEMDHVEDGAAVSSASLALDVVSLRGWSGGRAKSSRGELPDPGPASPGGNDLGPLRRTMAAPTRGARRTNQYDVWIAAHVEAGFRPPEADVEEADLPVVEG